MQQPSSCGVPRIRQWMVVVWLALGLIVSAAGVAHAQQTINPTGGTDATNGLRIVIQPNTAFQIYRNNANQLFRSNGDGLDLAVGTAVTGTNVSGGRRVDDGRADGGDGRGHGGRAVAGDDDGADDDELRGRDDDPVCSAG
jgi:hypothetical protein